MIERKTKVFSHPIKTEDHISSCRSFMWYFVQFCLSLVHSNLLQWSTSPCTEVFTSGVRPPKCTLADCTHLLEAAGGAIPMYMWGEKLHICKQVNSRRS